MIPAPISMIPAPLSLIAAPLSLIAAPHSRDATSLFPFSTTTTVSTPFHEPQEKPMTATTKTVSRPRVSLNLPRRVAELIAYATRVVTDLTGNEALPSPTPTLAVIVAAINALVAAQSAALARAAGAVTVRNEKRDALVTLLRQLAACVQAAADAAPENAASLIESTGMTVRKVPPGVKRTFSVVQGQISGSVTVQAAVTSRRAAYDWEYSTDGGKTWTAAPTTLQSRTTVSGLGAGTAAQFRYRVATKGGAGDWSQPTSFLVK
jgi:hypothetical protein